jgi:hypothetical protein
VLLQGGSAGALHAACATPDDGGGGGGPLLRGQLRSEARGGADEVAAEILLPCGSAVGDGSLQPRLQKVSMESYILKQHRAVQTLLSGRAPAPGRRLQCRP